MANGAFGKFTLASAADLTNKSITKIWAKLSEKEENSWKKVYAIESGVTDYTLTDSSLSGLAYAGKIDENAAPQEIKPVQGFDKTYTQVTYGALFSITKKMWQFGLKKRDLERVTREARNAVHDLREQRLWAVLENGFATSYTAVDISGNYSIGLTGGDALALFSASHTREDGGTNNSNIVTDAAGTVNVDFDYDAVLAAERTMHAIKNPVGKPMNMRPDTLVVSRGSANAFRAREILGAHKRNQLAGSADNDGSAMMPFSVIETAWFETNPTYWMMTDSRQKDGAYGALQYKEADDITLAGPNIVFKTEEIQYKATAQYDYGHNEYRNWLGSKNTNAA